MAAVYLAAASGKLRDQVKFFGALSEYKILPPSLAPFVEASERLRIQTDAIRQASQNDVSTYHALVNSLLEDLEEAFDALRGKKRDT